MAKAAQTEQVMMKPTEKTTTKSIGEENERLLLGRKQWILPIFFKRQPAASAESLDTFQPVSAPAKSVWTQLNPHRVHCPLCRRRNTVRLLSAAAQGRENRAYSCSYSGCRGLEWTE